MTNVKVYQGCHDDKKVVVCFSVLEIQLCFAW